MPFFSRLLPHSLAVEYPTQEHAYKGDCRSAHISVKAQKVIRTSRHAQTIVYPAISRPTHFYTHPTQIQLAKFETGPTMTIRRMIYLGIVAVIIVLAYFGWKLTARSAYESAEYTVLESDSPFETREYPDLQMATTNMQFKSQGDDGSFMRLFRYISGANEQEQKVAMTTPVFMEPEADGTQGQMGFVIPKNVAEQRVPEPTSEQVQILKRAGGRFAVIRFAGRMNRESVAKAEEQLRTWMNKKGLVGEPDAELAGYDPPWTPGPFRRNEVLIRLK